MLIREMQIKTTVRYYVTVIKTGKINITLTSSGENVEKLEYLRHDWWDCKMIQSLWESLAVHSKVEHVFGL